MIAFVDRHPGTATTVAGIRVSHAERLIYAELGATKLDVVRYYDAVAETMIPHVEGRPLTLLRCARAVDPSADKGGCEMLRHGRAWGPSALRRVPIREQRKTGEYLVADTHQALVALAQMSVVEIHTWNGRAEEPYLHDRVVFDLDPGPKVSWPQVISVARAFRSTLAQLGLESWVKTTGGKGLHIVVPVEQTPAADCLAFARAIAAILIERHPVLLTTAVPKQGREAKILVDTLRNNRTNTSVAAYSLRARGWRDGVGSARVGRAHGTARPHEIYAANHGETAATQRTPVGGILVEPAAATGRLTHRSDVRDVAAYSYARQ